MEEYLEKQVKLIEAYFEEIKLCIEKIKIFNEARKDPQKPFLLVNNGDNIISYKEKHKNEKSRGKL